MDAAFAELFGSLHWGHIGRYNVEMHHSDECRIKVYLSEYIFISFYKGGQVKVPLDVVENCEDLSKFLVLNGFVETEGDGCIRFTLPQTFVLVEIDTFGYKLTETDGRQTRFYSCNELMNKLKKLLDIDSRNKQICKDL